jgi:hypothetical protein
MHLAGEAMVGHNVCIQFTGGRTFNGTITNYSKESTRLKGPYTCKFDGEIC